MKIMRKEIIHEYHEREVLQMIQKSDLVREN